MLKGSVMRRQDFVIAEAHDLGKHRIGIATIHDRTRLADRHRRTERFDHDADHLTHFAVLANEVDRFEFAEIRVR